MTTDLFNNEYTIKPDKIINRCRKCKYIYNHFYGQMKYCYKQKDSRTAYGHKKIKANSKACRLFEKAE